jgi:hypothetical protein
MEFKQWSQINLQAKSVLRPDLGIRGWDDLNDLEKDKLFIYLKKWFFNPEIQFSRSGHDYSNEKGYYYQIYGIDNYNINLIAKRIIKTIALLNEQNKVKSFGSRFLKKNRLFEACADFHSILMKENESIVYELFSIYASNIIFERKNAEPFDIGKKGTPEFEKQLNTFRWEIFDKFVDDFNEVFLQFQLNVQMSRIGLIPRQENKITQEIYFPVIQTLSNPKWEKVNKLLSDSFEDFNRNSEQGYSSSVTNSIAALQAFLQIIVNGETGTGDFSELIAIAFKNNLIPNDNFSKMVIKDIQSFLMKERQETGIAHPKKEYATEKNARLVLNLTMVFLQHCIQD